MAKQSTRGLKKPRKTAPAVRRKPQYKRREEHAGETIQKMPGRNNTSTGTKSKVSGKKKKKRLPTTQKRPS